MSLLVLKSMAHYSRQPRRPRPPLLSARSAPTVGGHPPPAHQPAPRLGLARYPAAQPAPQRSYLGTQGPGASPRTGRDPRRPRLSGASSLMTVMSAPWE